MDQLHRRKKLKLSGKSNELLSAYLDATFV